ncbi:MAG: RNA polymerase sigma factor [Bryobacterales bacterium]|nr:RNA polymerase sigma factor [Bryobacterales bacterium]
MWNHPAVRGELDTVTQLADASDEDLLLRMIRGDEAAFTVLYRRRQGALYRFAMRMCGRTSIAEEVVQETFLVLIRDGGRWDASRGTVATWLFGVARNQALRCIDRDGRYAPEEPEMEPVSGEDVFDDLSRAENGEVLRQSLLSLPPHYREVAVMCDMDEMSYAEAAQALGCPVGTVRSRLSRAREMLAEKMRARMGCSL